MRESLIDQLKALWLARRREVAAKWNRSLPLGDYVVDRWEKARELGFAEGASCYDSVLVLGNVDVGRNTWIGPFVVLDGSGGLSVGANCTISAGTQLYSHDSVQWAITGGQAAYEYGRTVVGDNCYIGPHVVVGRGVRIGKGCIIGAHAVVLADIPDGSKAVGAPARVVGPATARSDAQRPS
jgi:acetyltransferase-like isoleucine patch superfamily enzyme